MAKEPKPNEAAAPAAAAPIPNAAGAEEPVTCGVVMPISATANHNALHWERVQQLLHRAIRNAGFEPQNVWVGGANDRITSRILKNLFAATIVVCDISELNPNVMLELGMRLTSKKPTIVIVEEGGRIPFDISDFEAIHYPSDLNIIDMETFFEKLAVHLNDKLEAWRKEEYVPFLREIGPIEILELETRAVGPSELIEHRLNEIMARLDRIDSRTSQPVGNYSRRPSAATGASRGSDAGYRVVVRVSGDSLDRRKAVELIMLHPDVLSFRVAPDDSFELDTAGVWNHGRVLEFEQSLAAAGLNASVRLDR